MPAYVSHTIMANEVYRKIDNHNVDKSYMITFSLGCDLSNHSKCRVDTHKIKQEEFILNIVKYIKENWGVDIEINKSNRKFDFAIYN